MKSRKVIAIVIVAMFTILTACKKKDKATLSKTSFGINGTGWKSDMMAGVGSSDKKIGFSFAKGIHDGSAGENDATLAFDEVLTLGLLDKKLGKQFLQSARMGELGNLTEEGKGYAIFSTFSDQGCVGCETFIVDSTHLDQNWVEITKEEGGYKKVWGKFNLVMIKQLGDEQCSRYPDTIRIENGEFYVEL